MVVIAIVSMFLSVVCLLYAIHVSIVYKTFNDNIKSWSEELDNATNASINRAARRILRELDDKITSEMDNYVKNKVKNEKENE